MEIAETGDVIYLGKDFPDEYAGSKYTRKTKGGRAKAKANAAQGIREMVGIASDKRFRENQKEKHSGDAANGWYYYTTRFAMPVYDNDVKTENYNIYSGCLVVNCTGKGKMYLYDLVDILYASNNEKTAALEVRPVISQYISVAEIKITEKVKLFDFTSNYDEKEAEKHFEQSVDWSAL